MIRKILLIITILLTSCGYQPLYQDFKLKLEYFELKAEGDQGINNKIINTLGVKENNTDKSLNSLLIKSNFYTRETSKNLSGEISTYRSFLEVKVSIIENNKTLKEQNFIETFSYDNKESKFLLSEYQKDLKQIMENNIIRKIRYFLNS